MTSTRDYLVSAVGAHRGVAAADRLCEACVRLFTIDAAAISLVFNGVNTGTLGASDERAREYDELQFTLGEGPCVDSVMQRRAVLVTDLGSAEFAAGSRWPAFCPAMLARGVRGIYAVPVLVAGQYVGALDMFRAAPGSLSEHDLTGALIAAELAELPLLDLIGDSPGNEADDPDSNEWVDLGAVTRAEVSQATGMLVGQLDVTPAEALVRLRAHAFAAGRSASEVARDILEGRLFLESD